jgi:D-alanine-D-alanine ligase
LADLGSNSNKKLRVGIIFGGRSAEHEVSLISAKAVINAINPEKYDVALIGITREGRWISLGDAALTDGNKPDPQALMAPFAGINGSVPASIQTALLPDPSATKRGLAEISEAGGSASLQFGMPVDVIFPVLHGPYGEDGTMQGLLELANVPYVGCGVLASAVGMDKVTAREVFKQHGLPVLEYFALKRKNWEKDPETRENLLDSIEAQMGYPCFVKPVNMGSSVGISKARHRQELAQALDTACHYDRKIMVEKALNPRELEIAVLGNDEPQASVVGEIHISQKSSFYSYTAKYQDNEVGFTVPADISPELSDRLRALAIKAYEALDCAGLTRVDFFQDRDTGEIYLNEVNTIPGFTPVSMYPMMWEKTGLSYPDLVDRLIELAIERHADKNRNELRV